MNPEDQSQDTNAQLDPSQLGADSSQIDPAMLEQMAGGGLPIQPQQQPTPSNVDNVMERKVSITIRELLELLGVQ